jgi:hypothetical protein
MWIVRIDLDHLPGMSDGQLLQQQRVDDAKNARVHAKSEGNSQESDNGKPWRLNQHAKGKTQIGYHD